MLPSQILLNNLLYDTSQLAIPTDNVDEEQLRRPSHWDIGFIRRFMIRLRPDQLGLRLRSPSPSCSGSSTPAPPQFRSGWFVESLATQTLVIFVIRTRRVPFFRSRPPPAAARLGGRRRHHRRAASPRPRSATTLGFAPLPPAFFAVLVAIVVAYLVCVEVAKYFFYRTAVPTTDPAPPARTRPPRPPPRRPLEPPPTAALFLRLEHSLANPRQGSTTGAIPVSRSGTCHRVQVGCRLTRERQRPPSARRLRTDIIIRVRRERAAEA